MNQLWREIQIRNLKIKIRKFISQLKWRLRFPTNIDYWQYRVSQLGERAVFDARHSKDELEIVTNQQLQTILSLLTKVLYGNEATLLDFGCGSGRFSWRLANALKIEVIAVDPIDQLLQLAPNHDTVTYRLMESDKLPTSSNYFDIIWVCLVLGGIPNSDLQNTVRELKRAAKATTVFCIVENTSDSPDALHWYFRSKEFYLKLFDIELISEGHYFDFDEKISIIIGKQKKMIAD